VAPASPFAAAVEVVEVEEALQPDAVEAARLEPSE
tara:strand:+ start:205 stop:309 length:105 start_codon:yes stop_codon:yes gene_type:complete